MNTSLKFLGFIAVAAVLGGCASVPMAPVEQDAKAKAFAVAPGKANLYVYRNETMGAAVKMAVTLNGKMVGQTASKTYFALEVAPGRHKLTSVGENTAELDVDAQAGRNYFVWQEMKMGMLGPRSLLHLVDEAKGKEAVQECKLIEPAK